MRIWKWLKNKCAFIPSKGLAEQFFTGVPITLELEYTKYYIIEKFAKFLDLNNNIYQTDLGLTS